MEIIKIGLAATLLAAFTGLPLSAQTPTQEKNQIKLMTYNVRHGNGLDNVIDCERIANIIRKSGAQFVGVQELDSVTQRSNQRDILKELALESRLYPTFGKAIDFGGGGYGIGILSAEKPLEVHRIPLPGREEARLLLVAEFSRFVLANVHLSLTPEDAEASLPIILKEAQRWDKPFFLVGDWNTHPDGKFVKELSKSFKIISKTKQGTYPAPKPTECIDYIALYQADKQPIVNLASKVVEDTIASDHRPVINTVQFKIAAEQMFKSTPYLQNPTSDGITIMAQTTGRSHCWVEYGTDTLHLQRARTLIGGQAICHDIEHKVRLNNLKPGERYYYRVCAQEIIEYQAYHKIFGNTSHTSFHSFVLPSENTKDFTALILNDLHDYTPTIKLFEKLAKDIPHDFTIFNGDCLTEPNDRDHAIKIIDKLTSGFDGASHPIFFVRGNHEIRNAYSAGMPSLLDNPGGKTYGAFNWGDTRFVLLDCGEDKEDDCWVYYGLNDFTQFRKEQVDFLKKELKSKDFKRAKRHILVHHIPIWGNTDKYQPCTELWEPILRKANFDIDFSAHTHDYQFHEAGKLGNPYPVVVGGGYDSKGATMCVLTKKGKQMTVKVLNTQGEIIRQIDLNK